MIDIFVVCGDIYPAFVIISQIPNVPLLQWNGRTETPSVNFNVSKIKRIIEMQSNSLHAAHCFHSSKHNSFSIVSTCIMKL